MLMIFFLYRSTTDIENIGVGGGGVGVRPLCIRSGGASTRVGHVLTMNLTLY